MSLSGGAGFSPNSNEQVMGLLDGTASPSSQGRRYSNPFYDLAQQYMPSNIKELIKLIRFQLSTNKLVYNPIRKLAEYPITELVYHSEDERLRKRWQQILEKDLNVIRKLKKGGIGALGYGNHVFSVYFPILKKITCKACKSVYAASRRNVTIKYRYDASGDKFLVNCPKCGAFRDCDIKDEIDPFNKTDLGIIDYDILRMTITHSELTGLSEYYYNISGEDKRRIRQFEDFQFLNSISINQVRSAFSSNRRIKLDSNDICHIKREGLPGWYSGWGWPIVVPVLKDLYLHQWMSKANEAIAHHQTNPTWVLFPQATPGADPFRHVDLGNWKRVTGDTLSGRDWDPNRVLISPIPVGTAQIGGAGKMLMLTNEIKQSAEHIISAYGCPVEFVFGGLQYSATNISIRMLANDMLSYRSILEHFLNNYLVPKLSAVYGMKRIRVSFTDLKFADDVQKQTSMREAAGTRMASVQFAMKDVDGWNWKDQQKQIMEESDQEGTMRKKMAEVDADIQSMQQIKMAHAQVAMSKIMARGQKEVAELQKRLDQPQISPVTGQPNSLEGMQQAANGGLTAEEAMAMQSQQQAASPAGGTGSNDAGALPAQIPPDIMQALVQAGVPEGSIPQLSEKEIKQVLQQAQPATGPTEAPNATGLPPEIQTMVEQSLQILQQAETQQPGLTEYLMGLSFDDMNTLASGNQLPPEVLDAAFTIQQAQQMLGGGGPPPDATSGAPAPLTPGDEPQGIAAPTTPTNPQATDIEALETMAPGTTAQLLLMSQEDLKKLQDDAVITKELAEAIFKVQQDMGMRVKNEGSPIGAPPEISKEDQNIKTIEANLRYIEGLINKSGLPTETIKQIYGMDPAGLDRLVQTGSIAPEHARLLLMHQGLSQQKQQAVSLVAAGEKIMSPSEILQEARRMQETQIRQQASLQKQQASSPPAPAQFAPPADPIQAPEDLALPQQGPMDGGDPQAIAGKLVTLPAPRQAQAIQALLEQDPELADQVAYLLEASQMQQTKQAAYVSPDQVKKPSNTLDVKRSLARVMPERYWDQPRVKNTSSTGSAASGDVMADVLKEFPLILPPRRRSAGGPG